MKNGTHATSRPNLLLANLPLARKCMTSDAKETARQAPNTIEDEAIDWQKKA